MTTLLRHEALVGAVGTSRFLVDWMCEPDLATLDRVEPSFAALADIIEALPPTTADTGVMCFFRNRIASARDLFSAGEWEAAGYEVGLVRGKLNRLVADEE